MSLKITFGSSRRLLQKNRYIKNILILLPLTAVTCLLQLGFIPDEVYPQKAHTICLYNRCKFKVNMVNVMYLPFASSSGISTAKYAYVSKLNKRLFLPYFRETAALLPQKWYFKQITQNPSKSLTIPLLNQKQFTVDKITQRLYSFDPCTYLATLLTKEQ